MLPATKGVKCGHIWYFMSFLSAAWTCDRFYSLGKKSVGKYSFSFYEWICRLFSISRQNYIARLSLCQVVVGLSTFDVERAWLLLFYAVHVPVCETNCAMLPLTFPWKVAFFSRSVAFPGKTFHFQEKCYISSFSSLGWHFISRMAFLFFERCRHCVLVCDLVLYKVWL